MLDSLWITGPRPAGACLSGETEADVVVVGAGITGMVTALRLVEAGLKVVVLEGRSIGEGNTGRSTGNLYATVSTGVATLRRKWDDDKARMALAARQEAIEWIDTTASRLAIDCSLRRVPMHQCVLNRDSPSFDQLREEHEAALALGLPAAWSERVDGWPLAPAGVHTLSGQAHFNPYQFTAGLAKAVQRAGAAVYEHSRVVDIDAGEGVVTTPEGSVRAGHIVLATHTPMGIHMLHTEMEVYREYGVAAPLDGAGPTDGFDYQGHVRPRFLAGRLGSMCARREGAAMPLVGMQDSCPAPANPQ